MDTATSDGYNRSMSDNETPAAPGFTVTTQEARTIEWARATLVAGLDVAPDVLVTPTGLVPSTKTPGRMTLTGLAYTGGISTEVEAEVDAETLGDDIHRFFAEGGRRL